MTYLLIATLCLQLDPTGAECRREVQGPFVEAKECWELIKPTGKLIKAIGEDVGAGVLFISVTCEKGTDG